MEPPCEVEDLHETRRDPRHPASAAAEGIMHVARPQTKNRRPVHRRRRDTGAADGPSPRGLHPTQHKSLRSSSLPPQSNAAAIAPSRALPSSRSREDRPPSRPSVPAPQASAATTTTPPPPRGGRSRFEKGMDVCYRGRSPAGATATVPARILDVHYDDVEPYYTIQLEGGAEKQTDDDHLALVPVTAGPGPGPRGYALDGSHRTHASHGDDGTTDGGTIQTERTRPVDPEPSGPPPPGPVDGAGVPELNGGVRDTPHDRKEEGEKSVELQCRDTSRTDNDNHGRYIQAKDDDAQGRPRRRKGRQRPQSGLAASCVARPTRDPPSNWNVPPKETVGGASQRMDTLPVNNLMASTRNRRVTVDVSPTHNFLEVKGRVEEDRLLNEDVPPEEPAVRKTSLNRRIEVNAREGVGGYTGRLHPDEDDSYKTAYYLKQTTLSTVEPDSTLASSIASSSGDAVAKGSASSPGLTKRKVHEHRCGDSDGAYGFYTGNVAALHAGTIDERDAPHGRGEMAYDDGTIAAGVWSKGELRLKVPPDRDRYVPRVLPGYKVGDGGHRDDMTRANAAAVGGLHVGDAAFIRRSDPKKRWSYAIVKSRADGGDVSITFQVNARTSTKTISAAKWSDHVRLPKRRGILPGYAAGDRGRDEDMIVAPEEETLSSLSKLVIGDAAFVRRASGNWVYAIVKDRIDEDDDAAITFDVDPEGGTKSVQLSRCATCVRRVRQEGRRDSSREEYEAPADEGEVDCQASNAPNVLKSPPLPRDEALREFVQIFEEGRVESNIHPSQQDGSSSGEMFHLSNADEELVHAT